MATFLFLNKCFTVFFSMELVITFKNIPVRNEMEVRWVRVLKKVEGDRSKRTCAYDGGEGRSKFATFVRKY